MTPPKVLDFGRVQIRADERVLRIDGAAASIGARAFDLLLALAERRDRVVGKDELLELVWGGLVVEEHNIATQVSSLRKLLGPNVIATLPGRGYRFVAPAGADVEADPPPEAARATPASPAPAASATAAAFHPAAALPEPRTRFIGRQAALSEVLQWLDRSRLITLTGVGGCGKTRLALAVAQRCAGVVADAICFVDLSPLRDGERLAAACAAALGWPARADPPGNDDIAAHLALHRLLLVLDNCEHLRGAAAALADAVLARPGSSRILATSREALGVAGEQRYPVPPLALPATAVLADVQASEAAQVFVDRARAVWPPFELDPANAAAVAEICRRLDGIALAIELAAARVPMLAPADIALRLKERFRLLQAPAGDGPSRQQDLRETLRWSCDLLSPAERQAFATLGVFVGSFTLPDATAVLACADDYEALALLTALHDKSLLMVEPATRAAPRYRMLETVRAFALQQLRAAGSWNAVHDRHAGHLLGLAERAAGHLRGRQQSVFMQRLRDVHEDLVAAFDGFSRPRDEGGEPAPAAGVEPGQGALRLAAATWRYWLFNDVTLGCRLVQSALQGRRPDEPPSAAACEALLGLAAMCIFRARAAEGMAAAQAALAVAQRLGDVEQTARALLAIGGCLDDGDPAALQHYRQARDLARAAGSSAALANALNNIANIDFAQGRIDEAVAGYREAGQLARERDDLRAAVIHANNLTRALVAAGRHDQARAAAIATEHLLREGVERALELKWIEAGAELAASAGDHQVAARWWGFALPRVEQAGYGRAGSERRQIDRLCGRTRQTLGSDAYEQAVAAGGRLAIDAVMLEVRQWLGSAT